LRLAAAVALLAAAWSCARVGKAAWVAYEDLHPARAPAPAAAPPGFEAVELRTSDGLTLRGWYAPPRNGAAILLAHGWSASRSQLLSQARALVRAGFGALALDLRAHGASDGASSTSGWLEQRDVEAGLALLEREGAVRLGAIGFSMGAAAVAEVASREERVAAVLLESLPPTLEEDILADHPSDRRLLGRVGLLVHRLAGVDVERVRPIDELCGIGPRPLLLVYGEADPGFPPATARRVLAAACDPKELWLLPGAGHADYLEARADELGRRAVEFFSAALLKAPPAGSTWTRSAAAAGGTRPRPAGSGSAPPAPGRYSSPPSP
jgi:pimeloyl-ACP methyl ester carboxylesterase